MWSGATTPSGWMACDGSAISRSNYPDLFAILGTTYGAGDGSSTFNIPDMRGRVAVGTGSGAGLTNRTLGQNGGKESQTGYTAPSMTSSGTLYASDHRTGVYGPVSIPRSWSVNSGNQGDTTIMQPFLVLEYIMNVLLETATTNGAGGSAFFFAWMGVATGLVFANLGSAYGTAKAGVGLMSMGVMNPGAVMKNVLPIILAAVLGIYGLIVAIIISSNVSTLINKGDITGGMNVGYKLFCAGLCSASSSLASGFAIGIVGDAGVRAVGQSPKLYVGMVLVMIFAEAIGLYGLIIALVLGTS
eukprot:g11060.t1